MAIKDYVVIAKKGESKVFGNRFTTDVGKIFKKHLNKYDSHTIGLGITHENQTIIAYDIENVGVIVYNTKIREKDTIQLIMISEDNKIKDVKSKLEKTVGVILKE